MPFNELFSLSGYGVYVWTTYTITLLVLGINVFLALREKKQIKKFIQQHFATRHES